MKMKVTVEGEAVAVDVDNGMGAASDTQIVAYARERFPELRNADLQVGRNAEGLSVYPSPQYG